MRITLFGNLHFEGTDTSVTSINTNRLQSLLAYLILHGDAPQPRESLAFTLWPASRESQARTNLRQLLHSLKRALPTGCNSLLIEHFSVQWRHDFSCAVDTTEFQAALAEAAVGRAANDRPREIRCLTTAAELYTDDLLPSLYDDWILPFRQEFRTGICHALHRLATILEEQRDYRAALAYTERLVVLDPLGESSHRLLIQLHAANHDRASALRAYHQCMRVLRREMGVEPDAATKELFQRILKGETAPPGELQAGPTVVAPPKPFSLLQQSHAIVGRTVEWDLLVRTWQTTIEEGPRIAIISGEPGIGKTKLADELFQSCLRQGHATARSRCYAGQGHAAYAPIAEWLRSDAVRVGWTDLRSQHLAELARLIPEIADQFPNLSHSGEPQAIPQNWHRHLLYESLNSAIGSSRKPILLYLDDMQWCDPDSLEWLNAFLTSPAASAVLLLVTVRAEETGRDHPFTRFLASMRQSGVVLEIPLEPLNAEETEELARRESVKAPASANLAEIFRTTRGNPLFVVESVRAGSGSVRVHAVISARLAQLTPPAYELAGLASVVARPFSLELLAKTTDWDERSVSDALDELWQRKIIEPRGASEYDFSHDLLRDVASSELSLVRKRYLHRRVAKALAEVHSADIESWNGQIASHFESAGMPLEAIDWFQRAAAHARQRYADTEAAELLRRALALCRAFQDSAAKWNQELDLLVALGPVLVTTEGYSTPEVGETYGRALGLSRQLDNRGVFPVLSGNWVFHIVRGDLKAAHQFSSEFLERARQEPVPALLQAGNFLQASSLFHLGHLAGSQHHILEAIRIYTGPAEPLLALFAGPDIGFFCRSYLAHLTWHQGDDLQAVSHAAEAVAMADRMRHPFSQAIALNYAALLHAFRSDARVALARSQAAVELCQRHGFAYYLAMANILTGWAQAAEGAVSAGLAQARDGLEQMRRLGAELRLPFYFKLLAETSLRAGLIGEAAANLSTGFAFANKNGEAWVIPELHAVQGELLAAEGRPDAAHASFERGLEAARHSASPALQRKLSLLLNRTPASAATERL